MKKSSERFLKADLTNLVDKFSKTDVITTIEKDYYTKTTREFDINTIDDNSYLRNAKISDVLLDKIANSIKEAGLKSPLIIRRKKEHYEIVFGRKRLLASKKHGFKAINCVVIDVEEEEMLLMLLADCRDQREWNVIEVALLCKVLCEEYGYSQTMLANFTHQSRSQVTNIMRLLTLPENVIRDISVGKLSYGHAKAIVSLPESIVQSTVDEIYRYKLSVREIEHIVKRYRNSDVADDAYGEKINKKFKCLSSIKSKSITLNFNSEEEKNAFILNILDD